MEKINLFFKKLLTTEVINLSSDVNWHIRLHTQYGQIVVIDEYDREKYMKLIFKLQNTEAHKHSVCTGAQL